MQIDTVIGFLADALSCVVSEERNGVFELTLTYPVTGALFDSFIRLTSGSDSENSILNRA